MIHNNINKVIKRTIIGQLRSKMEAGKVEILYGPRRVGKTTALKQLIQDFPTDSVLILQGDDRLVQNELSSSDIERLKRLIGKADLLVVDEAQAVPDIGQNLKLIVDSIDGIRVIASGSASFDLAQKVGEPLAGRKKTFHLYPLWTKELMDEFGPLAFRSMLEDLLIYGQYPELFHLSDKQDKQSYLRELIDSTLYKDLLALEDIRQSRKIRDLLTLIAFQIGKEVSLTELASSLNMGKNTVARYLDLLEKTFVLVNVRGFSRNLRKEVTKTSRYYFFDNGIRNALINNFNPSIMRNDIGELWENWLVMERLKKQSYEGTGVNVYFWRTYDQKEIDWIEESDGKLFGYEFSWQPKSIKKSTTREFQTSYPGSVLANVHKENFLDFVV